MGYILVISDTFSEYHKTQEDMSIVSIMGDPSLAPRIFQSFLVGAEKTQLYGSLGHLYTNCPLISSIIDEKEEEKGPIHFLSEKKGAVDDSFMAVWYLINGFGNDPVVKEMRMKLVTKDILKMWETFNYFHVDQNGEMMVEWKMAARRIIELELRDEKCYDLVVSIVMMSKKGTFNAQNVVNTLFRLAGNRSSMDSIRFLKREERTSYLSRYPFLDLGVFAHPHGWGYILYKRYGIYFNSFRQILTFFRDSGEEKLMESKEFLLECSEMWKISPAKVKYLVEEHKMPSQHVTICEKKGIVYTPHKEKPICTFRTLSSQSTIDLLIAIAFSPYGDILDGDEADPGNYFCIVRESKIHVNFRDVQYLTERIRKAMEETKDPRHRDAGGAQRPYEVLIKCSEYIPGSGLYLPGPKGSLSLIAEGKMIEISGLRPDGYGIITVPCRDSRRKRVLGIPANMVTYAMIMGESDEKIMKRMEKAGLHGCTQIVKSCRDTYEKYIKEKKMSLDDA